MTLMICAPDVGEHRKTATKPLTCGGRCVMYEKPNLWVWVDEYADEGHLYTLDDNAYLALFHDGAEAGHLLDFGTAQAVAFHLAVAPAQPEPQPGEFWWVRVDGRDSVGMIYASGSGLRVRCHVITGSQIVTHDGPLEQCTLIGRVPVGAQ